VSDDFVEPVYDELSVGPTVVEAIALHAVLACLMKLASDQDSPR
jgi:hypothetical protein